MGTDTGARALGGRASLEKPPPPPSPAQSHVLAADEPLFALAVASWIPLHSSLPALSTSDLLWEKTAQPSIVKKIMLSTKLEVSLFYLSCSFLFFQIRNESSMLLIKIILLY